MHIEKSYFTLLEILERWQITEADLIYLAENDQLRLSVRVFGVPMEFGDIEETPEGEAFRVPWEQSRFSGLLDLHACDVFQLFRCGGRLRAARLRRGRPQADRERGRGRPRQRGVVKRTNHLGLDRPELVVRAVAAHLLVI
ncbi:hypothetical protein [Roseovarius sp. SYSU LYC5161]|uniref:hypothetical protein n=1 Tax=Roseovarius halophilus (ex Wu et al. 2025) TaxID=3376060 RepID=UPI00399C491F